MLSRQFQEGRDLSGGQWQRLSVARGLYRDAVLVVADGLYAELFRIQASAYADDTVVS